MAKILIPVDGSESSKRAVQFVLKRTRERPDVHLLNAQLPIRGDEVMVGAVKEAIEQIHASAAEQALRPAQALLEAAGVQYTKRTVVGDIAESIAAYAKEQRVDEIVMGTRGLSAIKNLVLGSVASKVIHLVETPVTLIK